MFNYLTKLSIKSGLACYYQKQSSAQMGPVVKLPIRAPHSPGSPFWLWFVRPHTMLYSVIRRMPCMVKDSFNNALNWKMRWKTARQRRREKTQLHQQHLCTYSTPLRFVGLLALSGQRMGSKNGCWSEKKCSLKTTQNKSENITIYGKERVLLLISTLIVSIVVALVEEFIILVQIFSLLDSVFPMQ